jgi:hypothetical protein
MLPPYNKYKRHRDLREKKIYPVPILDTPPAEEENGSQCVCGI